MSFQYKICIIVSHVQIFIMKIAWLRDVIQQFIIKKSSLEIYKMSYRLMEFSFWNGVFLF